MAIDQRDVSSTLRFMDDRALQQYAAMHKSDPYIFPLAFQESQNRQKLRMQQQGAQGMQPQPKVADQALAQMAPQRAQPMPEDVGIGALPAGNMQFAAEGGIMGYEGYGEEAQQFGQEPVMMMAEGGHVPRYQGNPQDRSLVRMPYGQPPANMTGEIPGFVAGTPIFQTQPSVDPEEPFFRRLLRERQETVEAQRTQEARARAAKGQPLSAEDQARIAKADTAKAAADTSAQDMAQFDAASNLYMTERAGKQAAAKPAPVVDNKAAPRADTTRRAAPGAGLAAAAAAAAQTTTGPTDIDALQQKYFGAIDQEVGGLRNARAGLVAGITDLAAQNLAATKADIEKRGDVYKGREERLAKQEKGLEGMGDRNMGLALLQAGAAMMSTPGGLGVALGKGVQVGSERYAAGLDKIELAKSKFAEARDRLDDLRINRDDMNTKDIRAAEKEARESELKGKELLYNGLVSDLGIKQKNVTAIFGAAAGALETDKRIASLEKIAATQERGQTARSAAQIAATLNTPERMAFASALEKTKTKENPQGDPAAAYQSIVAMKREPVSEEKLRGDWLDPAKNMQIKADYPNIKTFEDYKMVFGGSTGGGGGGGGGFKVVGVR